MRLPAALVTCLTVALCGGLASPAGAATSRTVVPAETLAVGLAGSGKVTVRLDQNRLIAELRRPGRPVRRLLRSRAEFSDGPEVHLSTTTQGVALSVSGGPSAVWVGPLTGPLREVTRCEDGSVSPPAASVEGNQAAWTEGGCNEYSDTSDSSFTSPSQLAFGPVAGDTPVRRLPAPRDTVFAGVTLASDGSGTAAVLRPRFAAPVTEIRPFAAAGLGDPILAGEDTGGGTTLAGRLDDGRTVAAQVIAAARYEPDGCPTVTSAFRPDGSGQRAIATGGCVLEAEYFGNGFYATRPTGQVAAGDRIVSLTAREGSPYARSSALTSVRTNGGRPVALTRGRYRQPRAPTTDGPRVAWVQDRCRGDAEIVTTDRPVGALRACVLRLVRRTARVRSGRASVTVRCPSGCKGRLYDQSRCEKGALARFAFGPGTHRIRFRVPAAARREGQLLVRLGVEHGPARRTLLRLNG